jgi:ABC-type transport system involved in multi-copper enzyme maturation permease subunit
MAVTAGPKPVSADTKRRYLIQRAGYVLLTAAALVVGGATVLGSFALTQAALGSHGVGWSAPGVAKAVFGGVAYVVLINVFAASVAALLRSTAVSLGILMPLFFVASPALGTISGTKPVARFLPDQAGMQAMKATVRAGDLSPGQGLLVLLLWTVVAVGAGYWLIRRRDA